MSLFLQIHDVITRRHPASTTITAPVKAGQGSALTREIHLPKWFRVLLFGVLGLLVLQVLAIVVPMSWGWQWHNIGCDDKSWSMANEGGVMPLSQYWIAKSQAYKPGDIVSFQYKAGGLAEECGPSVKLVDATFPGWVHVRGMNSVNSMSPCWVRVEDVNGKIMAGPVSIVPTSFWRWATMGWTLKHDAVAVRCGHVLNWRFLLSSRTVREAVLAASPYDVKWSARGSCAVQYNNSFEVWHPHESMGVDFPGCEFWKWEGEDVQILVKSYPLGKEPPKIDIYQKKGDEWKWLGDASPPGFHSIMAATRKGN
jgi:hypothetical protein